MGNTLVSNVTLNCGVCSFIGRGMVCEVRTSSESELNKIEQCTGVASSCFFFIGIKLQWSRNILLGRGRSKVFWDLLFMPSYFVWQAPKALVREQTLY